MLVKSLKKQEISKPILKNVNISGNNIIVSVSDNKKIKKGQEVFVVTPSEPKTQFNRIKKMNDIIVRAKVEAVDGNSLILSSLPEGTTVVAAAPSIRGCIRKSLPVYVESIEKW